MNFLSCFLKDEKAAVTVDWVVLTAALVGMGIAVLTVVETGLSASATTISTSISSVSNSALS